MGEDWKRVRMGEVRIKEGIAEKEGGNEDSEVSKRKKEKGRNRGRVGRERKWHAGR